MKTQHQQTTVPVKKKKTTTCDMKSQTGENRPLMMTVKDFDLLKLFLNSFYFT